MRRDIHRPNSGGQPGEHFPGAVAVVTGHACPLPLFRSGLLRKRFPESRQIIDRKVRFPSDDLSSLLTPAMEEEKCKFGASHSRVGNRAQKGTEPGRGSTCLTWANIEIGTWEVNVCATVGGDDGSKRVRPTSSTFPLEKEKRAVEEEE